MKRPFLSTVFIVSVSSMLFLTACSASNGQSNESTEVENQEEKLEQEENTGKEEKNVEEQEEEKSVDNTEPSLSLKEQYEKDYDYLLYYDSNSYSLAAAFNYPHLSRMYFDNSSEYPSNYSFYDEDTGETLTISAQRYEITEDNNLVFTEYPGYSVTYSLEEKGSLETVFGTAHIYDAISDSAQHYETAFLETEDSNIVVMLSCDQYEGKIENQVDVLFTPIEESEINKISVDENQIEVPDTYKAYIEGNGWIMGEPARALGFNPLTKEWRTGQSSWLSDYDNIYNYYRAENSAGETLMITKERNAYNYFFGRGLVSKEEKAEVSTPFGVAKVYSIIRQDTNTPTQEEVALINNQGVNIVFEYYTAGNTSDAGYTGRLEELLPQLFE